jgi:acetyl esterase/lipase
MIPPMQTKEASMVETSHAVDGVSLLDPAYAAVLGELPNLQLSVEALPQVRAELATRMPPFTPSGAVTHIDHTLRAADGHELVARVYRPADARGALGCIYAIHGGGYVLGSYEMLDAQFDRWCARFGCAGVSIEYRLAPEHPYPTPLEDCYTGLVWTHDHHAELGIDPGRIGIQGTSAGGGLAAALALLARDRGGPRIMFQLLECPMLDDRQQTPSSRIEGLAVWSREANEFGWRSYLGKLVDAGEIPAYAAPARAEDLTGLPPALVAVGGADGFRDEDVLYALRLMQAGVPTELHVYPGAPHGAALVPSAPAALQWARDVEEWLGRRFASTAG